MSDDAVQQIAKTEPSSSKDIMVGMPNYLHPSYNPGSLITGDLDGIELCRVGDWDGERALGKIEVEFCRWKSNEAEGGFKRAGEVEDSELYDCRVDPCCNRTENPVHCDFQNRRLQVVVRSVVVPPTDAYGKLTSCSSQEALLVAPKSSVALSLPIRWLIQLVEFVL